MSNISTRSHRIEIFDLKLRRSLDEVKMFPYHSVKKKKTAYLFDQFATTAKRRINKKVSLTEVTSRREFHVQVTKALNAL